MNAKKYLVDFHTEVSADRNTLKLVRNNEVFEQKQGGEAIAFLHRLVRIEEITAMGFEYRSLEYDGNLNEWYEKTLVQPSNNFEGVTLMYWPEADYFEYAERQMTFTEMAKVEKMIKAFNP